MMKRSHTEPHVSSNAGISLGVTQTSGQENKNIKSAPEVTFQHSKPGKSCWSGRLASTPIIVDDFRAATIAAVQRCLPTHIHPIFFLTHMHADHYQGLGNYWQNGTTYCSEITRRLLLLKFPALSTFVQALPISECSVVYLGTCASSRKRIPISVTLINSNHCPGSIMLYFQGYFGSILHTGDLRYDPAIVTLPKCLGYKRLEDLPIDVLYLDNTFWHSKFQFPPSSLAIRAIVDFVKRAITQGIDVYIGIDSVGKEELIEEISQAIGQPVKMQMTRCRVFDSIGKGNSVAPLLTQSIEQANRSDILQGASVFVVMRRELTESYVKAKNLRKPCVGVLPTGWAATRQATAMPVVEECEKAHYTDAVVPGAIVSFPFSLHSSYSELKQFLETVLSSRKRDRSSIEGEGSPQLPLSIMPIADRSACAMVSLQSLCDAMCEKGALVGCLPASARSILSLSTNTSTTQSAHTDSSRKQQVLQRCDTAPVPRKGGSKIMWDLTTCPRLQTKKRRKSLLEFHSTAAAADKTTEIIAIDSDDCIEILA